MFRVVICLKNRTFAVSQTAAKTLGRSALRCDLLEKSYFCSITNSTTRRTSVWNLVVICLKNRTFAVSQTAWRWLRAWPTWLWFAWKIVLLQYHKQHSISSSVDVSGCDLLEKSYFCSITNSRGQKRCQILMLWFAWKIVLLQYHKQPTAVASPSPSGCDLLEKSYFCSITNSLRLSSHSEYLLWFAWKIVLLQYHKQR